MEQQQRLLQMVGERVRAQRLRRGERIADLATRSDLSPRYVSDVERGKGNISIGRLDAIAKALEVPLRTLLPSAERKGARAQIDTWLDDCSAQEMQRISTLISLVVGRQRSGVIALLGIRGAGKSSIGRALAVALNLPFIELVNEIEALAGMEQSAIFSFHGESYYRRLELRALTVLISSGRPVVVALPGGVVTHSEAFDLIKASTQSVWLRATPEEYLERVYAQGDLRPMDGHDNAMEALHAMVALRDPLYTQCDLSVNTSDASISELVNRIQEAL
jgi:XRE family aerobic/anaerobic benzoate catabolism transcriptional regulator